MSQHRRFVHRSLAGLAVIFTSLTVGISAAQAEDSGPVTFTLINSTGRDLEEFYASPQNVQDWEEDILGVDILPAGESVEITIDDGRQYCSYDFKGVLGPAPGVGRGALIQSGVNICDISSYEYSQ